LEEDHKWSSSKENGLDYSPDLILENDPESYPFYGLAKERSMPIFNSYHDMSLGDFVFCCPNHNNHLLVWLGRVLTFVDNSLGDNYGQFTMEWWTFMKGKQEGKHVFVREY
jgi:hypothetical protein